MLFVQVRTRLCDGSDERRTIEIGRVRSGSTADYVVRELASDGAVSSLGGLLGYTLLGSPGP